MNPVTTRAITKRDHTPQQLLVTKQINVTGMQNKRQTRAANCRKIRPFLRTKSVTKKEINKCMAEIYDPGGIRTRAARLINQYHNH